MNGTIPRRARYLTFSGLATLGLAVLAQLSAGGTVAAAETYAVPLHQATPITNSDFGHGHESCPGSPAMWGWHFVLTGGEAVFVQLTTTFQEAGVIVTDTFGPPDAKHAYVYTPTDDTLLSAVAQVSGGDPEAVQLQLSHTCAGGDTVETPPPTTPPPTTVPPTTPPPTTVPPTTPPPTTVPPTTPPPTTVPPTTPPATTVPPTTPPVVVTTPPSPEVSSSRFTRTPDVTISPSVKGVKQTRAPQVAGGRLPSTGNPVPVAVLLLLGFALIGGGVVTTIAGEPAPVTATPKHRR